MEVSLGFFNRSWLHQKDPLTEWQIQTAVSIMWSVVLSQDCRRLHLKQAHPLNLTPPVIKLRMFSCALTLAYLREVLAPMAGDFGPVRSLSLYTAPHSQMLQNFQRNRQQAMQHPVIQGIDCYAAIRWSQASLTPVSSSHLDVSLDVIGARMITQNLRSSQHLARRFYRRRSQRSDMGRPLFS